MSTVVITIAAHDSESETFPSDLGDVVDAIRGIARFKIEQLFGDRAKIEGAIERSERCDYATIKAVIS